MRHAENLLTGVAHGASGAELGQLATNVSNALADSFGNGDTVRVAGTDQLLATRLQVLNALNHGYMVEVNSASSTCDDL